MTIGGDYDSPEKEAVRERLWDTAFRDLIDNHGKDPKSIRVLDLPGAKCTYLRHLVDDFGIEKQNIVAVERAEPAYLAIQHFLAGLGATFHDEIENLCEKKELEPFFPMDVVNLDFCGQGFVFPNLSDPDSNAREYQRRWDCIKSVIDFNRSTDQSTWYLFLTFACNRNNAAGKKYLLDQLEHLSSLSGIEKDSSHWKDNRLIQEVVPSIIADESLHRDYAPSAKFLKSYRYVQEGHSYQMVTWSFKLELDNKKSLGKNIPKRQARLESFCKEYFATNAEELEI